MSDELYNSHAARLDTIIGDVGTTWANINRANQEYGRGKHPESFYVWLQQEYGIKLNFTADGDLTLDNEIVDQQKYMLFLLKFSS